MALALLGLSSGSVCERKTQTGARAWDDLNLALTLFELSSALVWAGKTLTGMRI